MIVCEVPHLRLTDGSAWRRIVYETKAQSSCYTRDLSVPPNDLNTKMSVQEISVHYKVGKQTALKWLIMLGVKKTLSEQTYDLYIAGMSMQDIGIKLGITPEAVRARLSRHYSVLGMVFYAREKKPTGGGQNKRQMPDDFHKYAKIETIRSLRTRYKAKYEIIKRWLDEYKKTC